MRWIMVIVVLTVSGLLLWMGVPRFVASILKAPTRFTVLATVHAEPADNLDLARAAARLEDVRRWENSATVNGDIGYLLLLLAAHIESEEKQRQIAAKAADFLERSLTLTASSPQSWVRLAFARAYAGEELPRVLTPLRQSIDIGPFVAGIAIDRVNLLLHYWADLQPTQRRYTYEQIRYIWPHDKRNLLTVAAVIDHLDVVRLALRRVPGALDELNQLLASP